METAWDISLVVVAVAAFAAGVVGGLRSEERGFRLWRNAVMLSLAIMLLTCSIASVVAVVDGTKLMTGVRHLLFGVVAISMVVNLAGLGAGIAALFRTRYRLHGALMVGLFLLIIPIVGIAQTLAKFLREM